LVLSSYLAIFLVGFLGNYFAGDINLFLLFAPIVFAELGLPSPHKLFFNSLIGRSELSFLFPGHYFQQIPYRPE